MSHFKLKTINLLLMLVLISFSGQSLLHAQILTDEVPDKIITIVNEPLSGALVEDVEHNIVYFGLKSKATIDSFKIEIEDLSGRYELEVIVDRQHGTVVYDYKGLDGSPSFLEFRFDGKRIKPGDSIAILESGNIGWGSAGPSVRPPVQSAEGVRQKMDELAPTQQKEVKSVPDSESLAILFDTFTSGGDYVPKDYPGILVQLPDGTLIGYRNSVKSGRESIDAFFPNGLTGRVIIVPGDLSAPTNRK